MTFSMSASTALLGIASNVGFACVWLVALLGRRCPWSVLQPLRSGCLKPLAVSVVVHWLLYFGPINLGALVLQSNVHEAYSWVIRRPLLATASLHSLVAYGVILVLLAVVACLLDRRGLNQSLRLVPNWQLLHLVIFAALLVVISAFIAPVIGTIGANQGAWVSTFPWLLQPWAKGLFLMEAIPLIAAGWQVFAAEAPPPRERRGSLLLLVALQLLTFTLLRQRFLSLLAVLWVLVCLIRWWRKPLIGLWLALGLLAAYVVPTALRYARVARLPGQPLQVYLAQSWQSFATGLQPMNLVSSAINDFSYNKAGLASLSVVLDLRRSGILFGSESWAWTLAEIYRATPGAFKPMLASWGAAGSEVLVTRALGIGLPGWSHPGVSSELSRGWVVDLMETPLLDPVTSGGWGGLLCFSALTGLLLPVFWCIACWLQARWSFLWLLPCGILGVVSVGPSWWGDLLVFVKLVSPWIVVCGCLSWLARREKSRIS